MLLNSLADGKTRMNVFCEMFLLFLNTLIVVDFVRMLTNSNGTIVAITQYALYGIPALYTYFSLFIIRKGKIKISLFIIVISVFFLLGVSYLTSPDSSKAYSYFIPLLFARIIPAVYFASYILPDDLTIIYQRIKNYSYLWIAYALLGSIYISLHTVSWGQYASNFGFNLLLPACFSLYVFMKEKHTVWFALTIVFALSITLRGSRTALLCFVIFAFMYYCIGYMKQMTFNKWLLTSFLAIISILFVMNYTKIFTLLSFSFPSSRSLRLLANDLNFDSGRKKIHELFLNELSENPFKFRGLFSDRVFYSFENGIEFDLTGYPHNMIIEIVFQLGVLLASVVFVMIAYYSVKAFTDIYRSSNLNVISFVVFLFTTGIVRLFFSSSYLTTIEFYLYLGMILNKSKKTRDEANK